MPNKLRRLFQTQHTPVTLDLNARLTDTLAITSQIQMATFQHQTPCTTVATVHDSVPEANIEELDQ